MATKKTGKGPGPAPLDPKVVKKLLDLLSTDNEFRRLFKKDANAALVQAGYKPPAATKALTTGLTATATAGACLQMGAGDSIATKESIARDRAKLEEAMSLPFSFRCPAALLAS
ncbi:NHLP-related RiPP peptide [Luteimonas sp. SX5]|uniref:NHLP-related RiPP peptide n=1 Tax=Luteimonas galliterrae TaxID=2940486 RepID=A0ABT0MLX4_9GAMM|nr:NHLP-related RiPP peptide [Luteimonas galliterrae]MCL1635892.1 NHLP-related RiPP peptide [Luteimonas galliterrae]